MTGFDQVSRHLGPNVRLTADSRHLHQGRFRSEIDPMRNFVQAMLTLGRPAIALRRDNVVNAVADRVDGKSEDENAAQWLCSMVCSMR